MTTTGSEDDGIVVSAFRLVESAKASSQTKAPYEYEDAQSIDWRFENEKIRLRDQSLTPLVRIYDVCCSWFIIVTTGLLVGFTAAYLDVVSAWLSDLRQGVCRDSFWLDRNSCCMGLEPDEVCFSYIPWSQAMGVSSIAMSSIMQYFIYITLGTSFAAVSALLVQEYAPLATHSGVPETKALLGGFVMKGLFSESHVLILSSGSTTVGRSTLIIKALGLATAVASGLSLGKEEPLVRYRCCPTLPVLYIDQVHIACAICYQISNMFAMFRDNEGDYAFPAQ